jgi:methylated-DNA-protein-cysteine methyltransferase related protein
MARPKSFAELFLPPHAGRRRSKRAASVNETPAIQALWDAVGAIPRGNVATYGSIARAAGLPGRARLAGYALRMSPPDMNLPWHRVLGAGGRIVFPKTSSQYREQARRLRAEGVAVKEGRVNRTSIMEFDDPP